MSTPIGHIKISRKAYRPVEQGGDPFWNERREFSRWEAWEYLLQAAAYTDHKWLSAGFVMDIPRGHTPPLALSYLATAWGWGKKRVRIFLELLVEMDRIRAVSGARTGTVYLILNYDYYQSSPPEKGTDKDTGGARKGHAEGTLRAQNKAGKQVSKDGESDAADAAPPTGVLSITSKSKRVPASWQPNEQHHQIAASLGLDCDAEVEKFRDHTFRDARSDWDAAFRNWLRRAPVFGGVRQAVGQVTLDAGVWG